MESHDGQEGVNLFIPIYERKETQSNDRAVEIIAAHHSVHPIPGNPGTEQPGLAWWDASRRVFRQFAWLEVGFVQVALSRPVHQREIQAVRRAYK